MSCCSCIIAVVGTIESTTVQNTKMNAIGITLGFCNEAETLHIHVLLLFGDQNP